MTPHITNHTAREAALTAYVSWLDTVEFQLNNRSMFRQPRNLIAKPKVPSAKHIALALLDQI